MLKAFVATALSEEGVHNRLEAGWSGMRAGNRTTGASADI